jgi:hypothetical protein
MAKIKLKKTAAKADNTSVKKPIVKEVGPSYEYMGKDKGGYGYIGDSALKGKPASKDSAEYRRGFSAGINRVKANDKSPLGDKYEKGLQKYGFSGRYNEGYSEGKDKALEIKSKQAKKK